VRSEKTPEVIGFRLRNTWIQLELRGSAVWEQLLQTVDFALGIWKLQGNCIRFLDVLLALGTRRKRKDQLMHLFQHFYIHIKTPERLLKMFHKSVIYN
jgi:hypothetical protein